MYSFKLKQQKLIEIVFVSVLSRLSGMGRFGNRAKKAEEPFGFSKVGLQSRPLILALTQDERVLSVSSTDDR